MSYSNMDNVSSQTAGVSEILASDWNVYVRDNFNSIKFGHLVVTESPDTRPSGVGEGTMVYASDTDTFWVYDGGVWQRAVNTVSVRDLAITAAKLASNAVTTVKIADLNVTTAKIADLAVTTGKVANDAVTDVKLRNSSALSVIGRSANSSGDPADIAGTANQVLRVNSSSVLGFGSVTTDMIENGTIKLEDLGAVVQELLNPVGTVQAYAGSSAPPGWLFCNGQSLNATANPAYASLWSVIGTTYGGSGITAFNVPDLRGRAPIGVGQGSGLTNRARGAMVGAETHTLVTGELPSHTHTITDNAGSHSHSVTDPGHAHAIGARPNSTTGATYNAATTATNLGDNGNVVRGNTTGISIQNAGGHNHTINNTGGGSAHNNMQPSIALNYIIKV